MSDRTILERCILDNPNDKGLVKAFADYLQEFEGVARFQALKRGAWLRRMTLNAAELSQAEREVNHSKENRNLIVSFMAMRSGIWQETLVVLRIVSGSRPPRFRMNVEDRLAPGNTLLGCTVGARYVLELVKTLRSVGLLQ